MRTRSLGAGGERRDARHQVVHVRGLRLVDGILSGSERYLAHRQARRVDLVPARAPERTARHRSRSRPERCRVGPAPCPTFAVHARQNASIAHQPIEIRLPRIPWCSGSSTPDWPAGRSSPAGRPPRAGRRRSCPAPGPGWPPAAGATGCTRSAHSFGSITSMSDKPMPRMPCRPSRNTSIPPVAYTIDSGTLPIPGTPITVLDDSTTTEPFPSPVNANTATLSSWPCSLTSASAITGVGSTVASHPGAAGSVIDLHDLAVTAAEHDLDCRSRPASGSRASGPPTRSGSRCATTSQTVAGEPAGVAAAGLVRRVPVSASSGSGAVTSASAAGACSVGAVTRPPTSIASRRRALHHG